MSGVGDRVRQVRLEKGFTQKDLADSSGVCQQMISKLEVGKAQGTANIVRLALALDVSPAWLEGISTHKSPQERGNTAHAAEGIVLNHKALQACIEYLSGESNLFKRHNHRRQATLFALCYQYCTQTKNKKLDKAQMVTMLSRRIKQD